MSRVLAIALLVTLAVAPVRADAQLAACGEDEYRDAILPALARIDASQDPCGESADVRAILATVRACTSATYRVCTSHEATRNLFDRLPIESASQALRVITWNPELESEVELGCRRDPTASLLHELVHAAHDCRGIDPGTQELEALRIENIYRRAAGLCQRSSYGDEPLPASMRLDCQPGHCSCAPWKGESGQIARSLRDHSDDLPDSSLRLGDAAE